MNTPEEIVTYLKKGDRKTIEQLSSLLLPVVSKWILKNHGTTEDVKDVFHDAWLIVIDKIRSEELIFNCQFSTYFISICKHLWYHELRKKSRLILTENIIDNLVDIPYDPIEDKKYQIYLSLINKLDTRSKELIRLILLKKPQNEIAVEMNFKNVQAVADKKKNCIKRMINELLENNDYNELQSEISDLHREFHS